MGGTQAILPAVPTFSKNCNLIATAWFETTMKDYWIIDNINAYSASTLEPNQLHKWVRDRSYCIFATILLSLVCCMALIKIRHNCIQQPSFSNELICSPSSFNYDTGSYQPSINCYVIHLWDIWFAASTPVQGTFKKLQAQFFIPKLTVSGT